MVYGRAVESSCHRLTELWASVFTVDYGCGKDVFFFKLMFLYFFGVHFLLISKRVGNFSQN